MQDVSLLYVVVVIAGLGMGAINALEPTIVSEMFGTKNMGKNYMLLWVGQFGTVVLLAQLIPGWVYESHITDGSKKCMGPSCFSLTFLIAAAVNATGILSASCLMVRQWQTTTRNRVQWCAVVVV